MADRLVMAGWLSGAVCAGLAAFDLLSQDMAGWRAWTPCAAVGLSGLLAWRSRPRAIGDRLTFDAGHWSQMSVAGIVCATGRIRVCLDMQRLMLVRLDAVEGGKRWHWVDEDGDPASWSDLRRALYASERTATGIASREGRRAIPA